MTSGAINSVVPTIDIAGPEQSFGWCDALPALKLSWPHPWHRCTSNRSVAVTIIEESDEAKVGQYGPPIRIQQHVLGPVSGGQPVESMPT